jgi:disulfide bond formation protein DsbB
MMDTDATGKVALDHAWNWFNLHAGQRMQTFNFFLIATAFLIAAYASLLEKLPLAALAVALIGAWIAFWFTRLDNRTRQLIDAGEDVLKACQESLAKSTNIPALEILRKVEKPTPDASSYRVIIAVIEWTIMFAFLFLAAYASYRHTL